MSTPARIEVADRRARLASRHHLAAGHRAPDTGAAAYSLIGLHSTDPASVYLSAWARVDGLTHADVDRALYEDRTLVKHLAMRRTVWAVATGLLPVVQAAASDDVAATQRRGLVRDLERGGITADGAGWIARAEGQAVAALAEHGPLRGRELTAAAPLLGTKVRYGTGPKAQTLGLVSRITTILSASGQVTRARAGGAWHDRQPRWALTRDWVPDLDPSPPASVARAALARCWLRAFGPATRDDLKWWTGWTVSQTKAALIDIGAVDVGLDDGTGVALPDDLEPQPTVEPWVRLLPSLDPTAMGWKNRDWYFGRHRNRLFDPYGNAGPTVWCDGQVVGGWGQRPDGEVVVRLLQDVGAEAVANIDAEAVQLTAWLDGTVVRPSFPTPLQRELSA